MPEKKTSGKNKALVTIAEYFAIASASLIYSAGLHFFTVPNDIAPGGVGGIATVLAGFLPLSVGMLYGLLNIPLLVLGLIFLGGKQMVKTAFSVAVITVSSDWLLTGLPVYEGDMIIAAVFGGVMFGTALGIIYLCGSTSGGTDIINKIINIKYPHISLGTITLSTDIIVIAFAVISFGNIEAGLYAIIAMFVCGRIMDVLLYGSVEGKAVLIFSQFSELITQRLLNERQRGVTLIKGSGAFSGKEKDVVFCALRKNEYAQVKRLVMETDPSAFLVSLTAGEILGEGFSPLNAEKTTKKRKGNTEI